jgi:gamma-glutamyltranspeptidase/glutathione hydrolase
MTAALALPLRPAALAAGGLVASDHPLASLAGIDVLRQGGRAADAAIAVNAVLAVVQPHMCGVGGDLFLLHHEPATGEVTCLDGAGRAGRGADPAALRARGLDAVPLVGPLAVTVPGCVAAWAALAERHGTRPLGDLLAPAIALARDGFPVSPLLARAIRERAPVLDDPEWRRLFTPGGRPLAPGARLRQPDLAGTLEAVARDGPDAFYRGELAGRLVRPLAAAGGSLAAGDLAAHRSRWRPPLAGRYRGRVVYQTPPPTQGLTLLQALALLEDADVAALGPASAERVHLLVETLKVAYADRDRAVADPDHLPRAPEAFLEPAYLAERRARVRARVAAPGPVVGALAGDTTGFVVAARDRGVVAVIQSLYSAFGSGVVPPGTGVVLQNRGAGFSLDPASPNVLAPGKQPFHTLIATLATRDGAPCAALATMGGHGQPQTHLQVLTHLFDHGLDPQQALEAPRFVQGRMRPTDPDDRLRLERRAGAAVAARLRAWGHRVELTPDWTSVMGHAHALTVTGGPEADDWLAAGGADPRGDGLALGY